MRGPRNRVGERFSLPAGTPPPDGFGRKDKERDPDEDESNQMRAGKRLVKNKNAEEKTARWGQVLKKPESSEPKVASGMTKPDEG